MLLCDLSEGDVALIERIDANGPDCEVTRRLRELGFVPGARCEVVARMWLGGDPIAVRVGGSTFALRRREASHIGVTHAPASEPP